MLTPSHISCICRKGNDYREQYDDLIFEYVGYDVNSYKYDCERNRIRTMDIFTSQSEVTKYEVREMAELNRFQFMRILNSKWDDINVVPSRYINRYVLFNGHHRFTAANMRHFPFLPATVHYGATDRLDRWLRNHVPKHLAAYLRSSALTDLYPI